MLLFRITVSALLATFSGAALAEVPVTTSFSGVLPHLTATAESAPAVAAGLPSRSEAGIGALMPWADRLYMLSYLSVPGYGAGTGLYEIDEGLSMLKVANHSSVFANRMIHHWTDQIVIGPYVIDAQRNIRVITDLLDVRIGAMAEHLLTPETHVYMVSMDGPLYEVELASLRATKLLDLVDALAIPVSADPHTTGQCYPHFKDAITVHGGTDGKGGIPAGATGGLLYVASNGYNEADFVNGSSCGRLASWDGTPGGNWTVLETTAFYGLAARKNYGRMLYASGWDRKSALLRAKDDGSPDAPVAAGQGGWRTMRLPKASHAFDHGWQTEWPRIREVETERYLLDVHGLFYELSPLGWGAATWAVRPISQHLRVAPDFCSFRGMLVMGGNQVSSIFDNNVVTGQSQSGLWLGKTDDLWSWGKPQGTGSVWREERVDIGVPSDPYLMTGFDKKVLHLSYDGNSTDPDNKGWEVAIELDTLGTAMVTGKWRRLATITLSPGTPYVPYVFADGLSAHWVRVQILSGLDSCESCTATFVYT